MHTYPPCPISRVDFEPDICHEQPLSGKIVTACIWPDWVTTHIEIKSLKNRQVCSSFRPITTYTTNAYVIELQPLAFRVSPISFIS